MAGKYNLEGGSHSHTAGGATFGAPNGALRPDVTAFKKKNTGQPILISKADVTIAARGGDKKQAVPKRDEKPIQGLVSDKNYIVANAVENILAAPKIPANKQKDFLKKGTYGKVPKYMNKIKNEIEDEYNLVREMQIEEQNEKDRQKFLMPEEERQELISALKKKWDVLHHEFQKESHHRVLDTLGKKSRKEQLAQQLDQVERDIKKLSKNYIFVDTTAPSSIYW